MNDLSEAIERLAVRIATLEGRVSALEENRLAPPGAASSLPQASTAPIIAPPLSDRNSLFSVLGRAMLAVAGAYLLRALAESAALPRVPLVALALVYAFCWLFPAARARTRLPSLAWATTSTVILLPMLWELTVHFAFLPHVVTAGVLTSFVVAAFALTWNHHFAEVAWIASAAASLAAVALALAAHDLVPFLVTLFFVAAAGEIAAARNRTPRLRPLVAAAADFLVFALVWIYSRPVSSRTEYPALDPALLLACAPLLLLLYAGSASTQTLLLRRRISFFHTAQTLAAFLLVAWEVLAFRGGPGARFLGILCLAAGYTLAFAGFDRSSSPRNFHVYASGSVALLLAGCWLSLNAAWLPFILCLVAITFTLFGIRTAHRTLEFHGLAFLLVAAFSSGLLMWTGHALIGSFPASPGWTICTISAAAILCYSAVAGTACGGPWPVRLLHLLHALLALGATAGLLLWGLVIVTAGAVPAAEHLAFLRTVTGCALTVFLAWAGSRRGRRELIWLAWISITGLAFKLVFEDLRHAHPEFTAASIFVYAITLLAVPRLVRGQQDARLRG